jgi:YD repeat-containing protein
MRIPNRCLLPHFAALNFGTASGVVGTSLADGSASTDLLYPNGQVQKSWGGRAYRVEYTYDSQGRLKTMKTWQNFAGDALTATTRWNYDHYRGWLISREYPNGSYWVYTYDELGKVVSGRRYWTDGTEVVGQQLEDAFDDIGNRKSSGGRASAACIMSVTTSAR